MTDKYELKKIEPGTLFYYKNGMLHREAGPAIVAYDDIRRFSDLNDKGLYPSVAILFNDNDERPDWDELDMITGLPHYYTSYYLNNKEHSKEEFKKITEILKTKAELDEQLPTIKIKEKTIKI